MLLFPVSTFALPRVPFSASAVGPDPLRRVVHLCPDLPRPIMDLWARYDNDGHRSNAETRLVRILGMRPKNSARVNPLDCMFMIMGLLYPGLRAWNNDPDGGILWLPGDESACEEMDAGPFGVLYFQGDLHLFIFENTATTSIPYAKEYLGVPLVQRVWWHILGGGGYRVDPLGKALKGAFRGEAHQIFWRVESGLSAPFGAAHSRLGILVLDPFFGLRKAGMGPHGKAIIHAVGGVLRACQDGDGIGAPWGVEEGRKQTARIMGFEKNRQETDVAREENRQKTDRRKSENRQETDAVGQANLDGLEGVISLESLEKQYKNALEEGDIEKAEHIMREMGRVIKGHPAPSEKSV